MRKKRFSFVVLKYATRFTILIIKLIISKNKRMN